MSASRGRRQRRARRFRGAAWIAVAIAALALAAPALSQEPRASLADIEDEVMCPICGTLLELSGAPQAERERELIRRLIDQGLTKEEIKERLVAEYGEEVLAVPEDEGFDLTAWVVPLASLLVAAGAVALAIRRRRSARQAAEPAAESPSGAEAERLDRDLARYDL